MGGRAGSRRRIAAAAACTLAIAVCSGCTAAHGPTTTGRTPVSSTPRPSATEEASVSPLDDGTLRAAAYLSAGASVDPARDAATPSSEELAAGTLVDLGDGCLGLESADDGQRRLAAFPAGTTLVDGLVSPIGMDPFGLGQPLRYTGTVGAIDRPRSALAVPDGCAGAADEVWYFVVAKRAGIGGPGDE